MIEGIIEHEFISQWCHMKIYNTKKDNIRWNMVCLCIPLFFNKRGCVYLHACSPPLGQVKVKLMANDIETTMYTNISLRGGWKLLTNDVKTIRWLNISIMDVESLANDTKQVHAQTFPSLVVKAKLVANDNKQMCNRRFPSHVMKPRMTTRDCVKSLISFMGGESPHLL